MGIRERFFTQRVAGHGNKLHREVVMTLNLLEFKKHLENALRHRVRFLGAPVWSQELESMILMGLFQRDILGFYELKTSV